MIQIILANGYFPAELPPVWDSSSFAKQHASLKVSGKRRASQPLAFTIPKKGKNRRWLKIPHPLYYLLLTKEIVQRFPSIETLTQKSSFSLSAPYFSSNRNRAISPTHSFTEVHESRFQDSLTKPYYVQTDLAGYYASLYTHSIPWAIHGKEYARANRRSRKLWGNQVDALVRNMQEGQTMGIPVGPDLSFWISEVVAQEIDFQLQEQYPTIHGSRFLDDYRFYVEKVEEGELLLQKLSQILDGWKLRLNPYKTRVGLTPELTQPVWKVELMLPAELDQRFNSRFSTYLEKAVRFAKEFPEDSVLRYVISQLASVSNIPNLTLYEKFLFYAMRSDGRTISLATNQMLKISPTWKAAEQEEILARLHTLCSSFLQSGKHLESLWLLYFFKHRSEVLPTSLSNLLSQEKNPLLVLLSLDLWSMGLLPDLDRGGWNTPAQVSKGYDLWWMVAYESESRGWLKGNFPICKQDAFFQSLRLSGVSFYDEQAHRIVQMKGNWFATYD
ncbi:RNA-directed DNA polymerase [Risungbinella massiliensis]|uniref:RNA-directed DNA polymerase n=1 Tax=Risungbinella massiliensis TaxID=1329796 RepID=UPI0005CC47B7|nr:RNA-directed DNA polymerase [Risungbinella massiliensis]